MTAAPRRLGLIGDVHAEDARLAAALAWLSDQAVDAVLAVGDIVDGAGDVARCCALLQASGALVVRGNHERWLLRGELRDLPGAHAPGDLDAATLAWLAALPPTRRVDTLAGPLCLGHGVGADDMIFLDADTDGYALACNDALAGLLADPTLALAVGGHTHRRMARRFMRPGGRPSRSSTRGRCAARTAAGSRSSTSRRAR